jgi:hypothetical protein
MSTYVQTQTDILQQHQLSDKMLSVHNQQWYEQITQLVVNETCCRELGKWKPYNKQTLQTVYNNRTCRQIGVKVSAPSPGRFTPPKMSPITNEHEAG